MTIDEMIAVLQAVKVTAEDLRMAEIGAAILEDEGDREYGEAIRRVVQALEGRG